MRYVATITTPGYLPDGDDEPAVFDTPAAAWWHLYHERVAHERENVCDLCDDTMTHGPLGDCDDDSETGHELAQRARNAGAEPTGSVSGPTPGYRGDHDLGLVYSVDIADDDDSEA